MLRIGFKTIKIDSKDVTGVDLSKPSLAFIKINKVCDVSSGISSITVNKKQSTLLEKVPSLVQHDKDIEDNRVATKSDIKLVLERLDQTNTILSSVNETLKLILGKLDNNHSASGEKHSSSHITNSLKNKGPVFGTREKFNTLSNRKPFKIQAKTNFLAYTNSKQVNPSSISKLMPKTKLQVSQPGMHKKDK